METLGVVESFFRGSLVDKISMIFVSRVVRSCKALLSYLREFNDGYRFIFSLLGIFSVMIWRCRLSVVHCMHIVTTKYIQSVYMVILACYSMLTFIKQGSYYVKKIG